MSKRNIIVIILIAWIALSGCVKVPEQPVVYGGYGYEAAQEVDCFDEMGTLIVGEAPSANSSAELNSQAFRVLNWNSYKGNRKGWEEDLERLGGESDIIVLQEGFLTESLQDLLQLQQFRWDIASAFTYYDVHTGVLTASRVEPESLCSFMVMEPISGLPKTVLVTSYPLSDSEKKLLVVNLHMINFTLDSTVYRSQLETVAQVLQQHDGPFIMAGDFNSWSDKRMSILTEITEQLLANQLTFRDDKRTSFMGNVVDHIYYRGLVPIDSLTEEVSTSDHNPMLVTFRLAKENVLYVH